MLARASADELGDAWTRLPDKPDYDLLRKPETGLVMVQGRAGGTGGRFNFGEMTVTRCTVRTADGLAGFGYVSGRDAMRAEIAAVFDALLQDEARGDELRRLVIEPLARAQTERRQKTDAKTAATRVDFFTLVRGEDE